ncbi:Cytochrome P450 family protein [Quillaja saponaria]|uniref:Cytochrome P450 family protein n=1 Tax=Quillaja saponaria TaxID=32244 RepID=A0AAD7VLS0_QUISA|nr:Cytochrome P450 family protein [Quillaja saponaria]
MPEKGVSLTPANQWVLMSRPLLQWRFGLLTAFVFIGMVVVWSIDGCTIKSFIEAWRFRQDYLTAKVGYPSNRTHSHQNLTKLASYIPLNVNPNQTNETQVDSFSPLNHNIQPEHNKSVSVKNSSSVSAKIDGNSMHPVVQRSWDWILAELEPNLTSNILARWLAPGGKPCRDSKTVGVTIPGLDSGNLIELSAGDVHEFSFQALDDSGKPRCLGGDYFETDLSGDSWKSRPLVKDFGNGSYSVSLQVHPDFTGEFILTVILLYRHFEGLKFTPWRFVYDRVLCNISIRFYKTKAWLPELHTCNGSDFSRDVWSGRWTRHGKNEHCQISNDGRYRCLAPDFPCKAPWCDGSLGLLESNGWVYSTHCSFKIFSAHPAWNCLKNRWIFFWGDSNHVDTIRNILNFILDLPEIHSVPRRFDMNFSNPKDPSQSVRITSIFNGHWNETQNYLGLDSLKDEGFQNLLKKYFSEERIPDTMVMNSGLHDGVHWHNLRTFSVGAGYAASFWADVKEAVRNRGMTWPKVFYRNTVATGGYARTLAFNPNKMEVYNGVLLEKLRQAGVVSGVIDNFDMTFPWHFDNRCNDGVHYGRVPAKMKWRDGQIGHQYFVDLMLAHVLLNALCAS